MKIKIGINGFGRIGRLFFRSTLENPKLENLEVVAINDLLDINYIAYLLKYDSVHGIFQGKIEVDNSNLIINGKKIRITAEKDPSQLKWDEVEVNSVVESTGLFLTKEKAQAHLQAGAKKVII